MSILNLFWIFFIISSLLPAIQKRMLQAARLRLMRELEKQRDSRVITLIHRQETMALLGFPLYRYIDIDDSEEVLRAVKLTDDEVPIDLILHTPGGLLLASEQIAHALCRHPAKVTVFVPHYAMSGGTLLALAADEIVMDENAVLGPVDPQVGEYPAVSILKAVEQKSVDEVDDKTLILAEHLPAERAQELAQVLSEGRWTHDYPITVEEARELGLAASTEMPESVYKLMTLYRQPGQRRPSVQYIPVPYRPGGEKGAEQ
jgi:ClpP class serine protease